jgi:hypothetical protein
VTKATEQIVLRALDEALVMSIINLYEVVNQDTSDEGIERFAKGLRKTVDLHDRLIDALRQQENGNGL